MQHSVISKGGYNLGILSAKHDLHAMPDKAQGLAPNLDVKPRT